MLSSEDLNALISIDSAEALWHSHLTTMSAYGFDRLLYGSTRFYTDNSFGDPDDFVVLSNFQPEYTRRFIGDGLYFDAPMVRWALEHEGARSWRHLTDPCSTKMLSQREKKILEFNHSMGVVSGYTISFKPLFPRARGAIALVGKQGLDQDDVDEIWARSGEEILLLNNLFHLRLMVLPQPVPARALTSRQKEVLEWVGEGKTTKDIAQLLDVTQTTIEKHLRLARSALGVNTTAQALIKATYLNQIYAHDV